MKCSRCGGDNPPAARFCNGCGGRLALPCGACGHANPADGAFCSQCGRPLGAAPTGATGRFGPPGTYTPRHLAERILTSRVALEGERKQVTILFADLKGSLELLADRDPEDARALLDAVLERMMEAVHRYEGTVNQVLGDGIMALFGAPVAHEDHAVRACYAALHMQQAVERYAEELRRTQGLDVQIRVGLNSGDVVVRSIGNDLHMDYTAVGQTTHLAARLEQLARPGTILATGDTARLVTGYVQLRSFGVAPVRGLADPVEVHEVIGSGPARSRLEAAAARGLTRFVGREGELSELDRALDRAAAGRGQVVGIAGEPGVGKSRLVWEFTHSPRARGWLVLEGSAVPIGTSTAYLPIIGLLRHYFQIEDADDARKIREKVSGRLVGLDESLGPLLPPMLTLLDVPVEDEKWRSSDPTQRRRRILDAVRRLLLRESRVQPVCVVIDDAHWADSETQTVLDGLVESLPAARLLLLVSYRTEYRHEWTGKTYYEQIRVDPLPPERAQDLLGALLGGAAELAPLKAALIERTEGNPFFLEESVWNLVEAGALIGERSAYRLGGAQPAPLLPATVQAVLAARIDRLAAEDKRLLQAASVIGRDIPLALLQAIADVSDEEVRQGLARLVAAEFVYEAAVAPGTYVFKHTLTLDVAYSTLLRERRRALDARLVEAIERQSPDPPTDQLPRLAHHALRGEEWARAVRYCRLAGDRAFARSAHRTAVSYFEWALEALAHLAPGRESQEHAVDIRLDLRNALSPLGEFGRMLDYLREAERLAERLDDPVRLGRVCSFLTNLFTVMHDFRLAIDYGQHALALAEPRGDLPITIVTHTFLAVAHYALGDYPRALALARRNAEVITGRLVSERFGMALLPSVYSHTVGAWALAELGEFGEAERVAVEAVRIAEAADHPYSVIFAHLGGGTVALRRGDLPEAVRRLEHSLRVCQDADTPAVLAVIAAPLASAYARAGRVADALALLDKALAQAILIGDPYGHWLRTAGLSEAYLAAGRIGEALPLARQAVEVTRYVKARGTAAWASRLLGEIAAQREPAEAEAAYGEALHDAEALGMRPLAAQCRLGLGALHARAGRPEPAAGELARALELFRALDMPAWAARAEAELARTTRPHPPP